MSEWNSFIALQRPVEHFLRTACTTLDCESVAPRCNHCSGESIRFLDFLSFFVHLFHWCIDFYNPSPVAPCVVMDGHGEGLRSIQETLGNGHQSRYCMLTSLFRKQHPYGCSSHCSRNSQLHSHTLVHQAAPLIFGYYVFMLSARDPL